MTERGTECDDQIRAAASRQHAVVSHAQLLAAGLTTKAVLGRLKRGELRRIHRAVYLIGPIEPPRARELAAVLACRCASFVSHLTAAARWELWPERIKTDAIVEVTVPDSKRPRVPGVRVHRVRELAPDETTTLDCIPLTTPSRTLLDVASRIARRDLERALAQAFRRALTTREALEALLARHPARRGTARLRALLERDAPPAFTRSEPETRFLALIRRAQLPTPESNVDVCGYQVDFFWRAARLVVEIDGFAFHSSLEMFESDRRKDAVLAASGVRVIRVTWRQLQKEPDALLVRVAQALIRVAPRD